VASTWVGGVRVQRNRSLGKSKRQSGEQAAAFTRQ
jgi:hypothetical protein